MTDILPVATILDICGLCDQEPHLQAPGNPQISEQRPSENDRRQTHIVLGGSQNHKCQPGILGPQVKDHWSTNGIFCWNRKSHPKIHMESERILNSQNNLEKEEQSWRPHTYVKPYNKAIITKTVWYWHTARHKDQRNRIESPNTNLCVYDQMISNKGAKTT